MVRVIASAARPNPALAGLRRAYERVTGTCLASSAFYDRFTPQLASVMKRVLAEVTERIDAQRPRLHFALNSFRQVLVADGSVIRLHKALAPAFPSIWTNHMPASAKLHVVMNVVGRGPSSIQITDGSRHDLRLLRAGAWMRDKLLTFDLGYFQGHLFNRIGSASIADCVKGLPSEWQNTWSDFRWRCALRLETADYLGNLPSKRR